MIVTKITTIQLRLADNEFRKLSKAKNKHGTNWENFVLAMMEHWNNEKRN